MLPRVPYTPRSDVPDPIQISPEAREALEIFRSRAALTGGHRPASPNTTQRYDDNRTDVAGQISEMLAKMRR